jgi:hypothetical protein
VFQFWEAFIMSGIKKSVSFELQDDAVRMLEAAARKYSLRDVNKALRCLIDYAATDGDWDVIFGEIRCQRCGGRPGWTGQPSS